MTNRALPPLPIDAVGAEIIAKLRASASLVLLALTGAGKTTRVPGMLVDSGIFDQAAATGSRVIMLEPRRIAAKAAATRIADERGATLGGEVGYQVRFERQVSDASRIVVVTEGIFLRMLQEDPLLEGIGAVVFDEFHERSLDADLALAMARKVQQEVRPDLKLVVMSATLAPLEVGKFLGGCPVVAATGKLYPVAVRYRPPAAFRQPVDQQVAAAIEEVSVNTPGDILVFLPGVGEIRRAAARISALAQDQDWRVLPLYGDLPLDEQQAVLRPTQQRKIVLATNVAESSLTIEGITAVIDTGLAKVLRADPALGINRLQTQRISKASADQRAGRAGRTSPGVCVRLWAEAEQAKLTPSELPEIARVDLSGALLQLLAWGERDPAQFAWFETPPPRAVEQGLALLGNLEATDAHGLTRIGQAMAELPVHPRVARLLIEGARLGHVQAAALAAALLTERSPFARANLAVEHSSDSDVLDRVQALERFEKARVTRSPVGELNAIATRNVLRARDQLVRLSKANLRTSSHRHADGQPALDQIDADEAVLRSLLAGFSDRLARRRAANSRKALLTGGRGVLLGRECAVGQADLFVCVELEETGRTEALVRQASAVDPAWLPADRLTHRTELVFDAERERVMAIRQVLFGDLAISESPARIDDPEAASALLAVEAAARLGDSLRLDESGTSLLARIEVLRAAMPELELPNLGDDLLSTLLPRLCEGCVSFAELRQKRLTPAIQSLLTSVQWQALARHAPERIGVPSGSQIELIYERGKPPVLPVRIQEIFGMTETPRIAGGRVPVLMHLLGPNLRPQQITGDLASFWKNTYQQVRKDLRRRYPKHSWPDDPLSALPQRRPGKPRS